MRRFYRSDAASILNDKKVGKSLHRYFSVMRNEKLAKFMIAKKLTADFTEEDSTEKLWRKHEELAAELRVAEKEIDAGKGDTMDLPTPERSYFDLKMEIAQRILTKCHLCTRRCGVNRTEDELGYCGCGKKITVSSIFEHMGEEPELVPSGTVFTMGCTMRCKHCQNWTISQWAEKGRMYKPEQLAMEIESLRLRGCRNANLVGGEPTPWLQQWLQTFKYVKSNIPVVWNSNSYYSQEAADLLADFADVYLLDFKYGPADCAEKISDTSNYWDVCTRNHLEAKKHGELIIRLLVLPGHLECCAKPILQWIAEKLGKETRINVMFQYRPEWRAHEIPELRRSLAKDEIEKAMQLTKEVGLTNLIT